MTIAVVYLQILLVVAVMSILISLLLIPKEKLFRMSMSLLLIKTNLWCHRKIKSEKLIELSLVHKECLKNKD
jgi:hypothetical protein